MSVSALPTNALTQAVHQLICAPDFIANNAHLSPAERLALHRVPPVWPACPVFSPYASTHDGYSQIRVNGTKYLAHRVTYQAFRGDIQAGMDISHVVYLGRRTTQNINPRHLVQEPNDINQSRKLCFLFMEEAIWRWNVGLTGLAGWSLEDFRRYLASVNTPCALIHAQHPCDFWFHLWEELGES